MDNILLDNDEVYRHHKPTFEFDLCNGETCYIGKIVIQTRLPPPGEVEISISLVPNGNWRKVISELSKFDEENEFIMPGEQYAKYL